MCHQGGKEEPLWCEGQAAHALCKENKILPGVQIWDTHAQAEVGRVDRIGCTRCFVNLPKALYDAMEDGCAYLLRKLRPPYKR